MSTPITSIQGLGSGIKWQDLVDELISVDTAQQLTPIQNDSAAKTATMNGWAQFGTASGTLATAVSSLADGSAFGAVAISAPNSALTSRTLLTASATATAAPGTYNVQVVSTASAQQLSGNVVTDPTAALSLSGQFVVGGKVVTVAGTDSVNAIRDKINALNTGDTPSHVTASVLQLGGASSRLVLSSDLGGASGIDLRDVRATSAGASLITQLGFIDGKTTNLGSDGAARSATFSSSSQNVSLLLTGVSSFPAATTININGQAIAVDVQNQSLATIAANINAAQPNTASVETVTSNGTTSYRLDISGTVGATADSGSQPTLDLLGLSRGTTGVVQQQLSTSNVLLDGSGATATSATALLGLEVSGGNGAQAGDTFTFAGTKADGVTPVSLTVTVDGSNTVADMLSAISTGFSATGRHVTASMAGGKIVLTDDVGGDSGLSFSATASNQSGVADPVAGANVTFGSATATAIGRQRELTAGADARILVNGIGITRSSNTITDAIAGVTLNLQQAEAGTTIPVTVTRDSSRAIAAVQSFASAYNALQTFVTGAIASGGALQFNASVRTSFNSIKDTLLGGITGLPTGSAFSAAALVGVALDKTGKLVIDTTTLGAALASNPDSVKALFQTNGVTTAANFSYLGSTDQSAAGAYDVNITRAATTASVASTATNFVYAAGATPDTLTIGDSASGKTGSISLATGDTPDSVAAKLNTLFLAQGIRLSASNVSGKLTVKGIDFGSAPSFTIGYTTANGIDVAGQLGITAGIVRNGLDVQGSYAIGATTYAATGAGQVLTGSTGTAASGISMTYSGITDVATAHLDYAVGVAGQAGRIANSISATDGTVSVQTAALQSAIDQLTQRATDAQSRLDSTKTALLAQFTAMETALSKITAQGTWLTQQINAMNAVKN
jgi:flagellar hook-associated protein 2